ncbi:hypothetical protein, partial [Ruminiclostridium cellobioparum]
ISYYEKSINSLFSLVAKFFTSIDQNNILEIYKKVSFVYVDDFWELIEKFKVYNNFTKEGFKEFIYESKVNLSVLLRYKEIIECFGDIIKEYMLNDCTSAELLLDKYEIKHISEPFPLYFPKELNSIDKEKIIADYIDSKNPNLNYLRLMSNIQSNKDKIEISPKTLLKAKKRAEEQESNFFKENSGFSVETSVVFSETQTEAAQVMINEKMIAASYGTRWIADNLDYATLLNNFIHLFEFVDIQMRFQLVSKFNQMGVFERFISMSSQNSYQKGFVFEQLNNLSLLQMLGYYNYLFGIGVRLEEVIEWFFEEYLLNEFNVKNFIVTMPSSNSTFLEKCTNIMPALEAVLKQFSLFVEEGEVDHELLEIRSDQLIYQNIPSLIEKKYAYGMGDEYKNATFFLFSDQSCLGYVEKLEPTYNNCYELLSNEKIKISDYNDFFIHNINWLIEHQYLSMDEEYLTFSNDLLILLLKDLYFNDVITYWNYTEDGKRIMDELECRNVIEFESSLFSRPEQAYINYFLNKRQFNNGIDLRNKYSHTQPKTGNDEKMYHHDYMVFFRLFVLSIIKINDEFCTFDELRKLD